MGAVLSRKLAAGEVATVGGSDINSQISLRGFPNYRFRDRNAAVSFEDDQSKRAKILAEVNELQSTTHR